MTDKDIEYTELNTLYDECINYLKNVKQDFQNLINFNEKSDIDLIEVDAIEDRNIVNDEINFKVENEYKEKIDECKGSITRNFQNLINFVEKPDIDLTEVDAIKERKVENDEINFKIENEYQENNDERKGEVMSQRLRKLSQQLPKIIITQSNTSLDMKKLDKKEHNFAINDLRNGHSKKSDVKSVPKKRTPPPYRGYNDFPKRLVSKSGIENVALISNVPFEKIRLLNDTFHTLINLRWRWIVSGTVVVHFAIWLVFAVFWYLVSLAHYDFEPDPPKKSCITGGTDFVNIFLASVEAQTTIGFGDRTIDEECPETIFLFIMQLILGTGLSGVLTCVVYAKLTRPEKLSRDGVGFSKKAVISMRDGKLCLMLRSWDLNYDHIISSDFKAHFIKTHRTKEGEIIRYYARTLELQQKQFLLWPVTLVHVIDETSPLYHMTPKDFADFNYEITVSLKGASASMGTFTQSQTSYLPREVLWGHRFPSVVRYDSRKQKYVIDHKKLDMVDPVDTPLCSASLLYSNQSEHTDSSSCPPGTPGSFSERLSSFHINRTSSFRRKNEAKA